jgi:RsiW-degrading membrane proteinase PrsW (M82 family)
MSFDFKIILYIIFGILPSLVWLSFYLRKDVHPEPKRAVIRIFLWGAVVTLPVFFVQLGLNQLLKSANLDPFIDSILYWFVVIAFTEEFFKYLVIRTKIINSPDMDEPLDIMLYMVIAALGFAALENILYLFAPAAGLTFSEIITRTMLITLIRFLGATFLHTLCSAVIGYAVAISFCEVKRKYILFAGGLFIAVLLHGLYDFSIMQLEGGLKLIGPAVVILTLTFLVFSGFENLKSLKSVCKLNKILW